MGYRLQFSLIAFNYQIATIKRQQPLITRNKHNEKTTVTHAPRLP